MSRVLAAMSGGVDSSVAAALLAEAGHDVTGVTLKLWGGSQDSGCCAVSDVDDARRVCQQLGLDHFVFNYADEFDSTVVSPYVAAHADGLTPNPCIECNRHIKFGYLTQRAARLGFDVVATGHHVRVGRPAADAASSGDPDSGDPNSGDATAGLRLRRGADAAKDQSYVLYMLTVDQLGRLAFPVGTMTKDDVRAHADRLGLRTAAKPDSTDVCFITSDHGRRDFLSERIELTGGELVSTSGECVGRTDAVQLVTVGQRRGLDLGGAAGRRYAVDVDVAARRVTVGTQHDLLTDRTQLDELVWVDAAARGVALGEAGSLGALVHLTAQTSAHGTPQPAQLDAQGTLRWHEPHQRVAPGQAVVLYFGDWVLGGGIARA